MPRLPVVPACTTTRTLTASLPHPVPERAWQKISADIFTLGGKDYLLVIDYYLHFPEIALLEDKTASCVIIHPKSLFARYGIPEVLMCDNMPFSSKTCRDFAKYWNFDLV